MTDASSKQRWIDPIGAGDQSAPAMAPGAYIAKRREAAGMLSIVQVAYAIAGKGHSLLDRISVIDQLWRLERHLEPSTTATLDGAPLSFLDLVDRLSSVFAFDPFVYHALVGAAADPTQPVPQICRTCACSWHDPCIVAEVGPCAWAEQDLCSACAPAVAASAGGNSGDGADDLDHPEAGIVFAIADVDGDECLDCGGELGPIWGTGNNRTCRGCDTTFIGAGDAPAQPERLRQGPVPALAYVAVALIAFAVLPGRAIAALIWGAL